MYFCYYEKIGNNKPILLENMPFDIPDSWKWIRLPYISNSELGKTLNKDKDSGDLVPYICSINVYWQGICLDKVKKAFFNRSEQLKYKLEIGDLLICEGGEAGRSAVWDKNITMYYQNALHRVRFYSNINSYFYKFVIETYFNLGILFDHYKGVTIKHLVQSELNSIYFPLPPYNEQIRIESQVNLLLKNLKDEG